MERISAPTSMRTYRVNRRLTRPCRSSRHSKVYYAASFRKDVPQAVDVVSDILPEQLESGAIEHERDVILREQQEADKQKHRL